METRYMLVQEESLHWFIIPIEKYKHWQEWDLKVKTSEAWANGEVPDYAIAVDEPSSITFSDDWRGKDV